MLIRRAQLWNKGLFDVRISDRKIVDMGTLDANDGEMVVEAHGGLLLPGLHDHHIHLAALAARRASVICGPPVVNNAEELAAALARPGAGWLRGIGYHECVAGLLDATMLDRLVPDRPVRIQHRSGRMWFLNSRALDLLCAGVSPSPGLERENGRLTGRLFDDDPWIRNALGSIPPDLDEVSRSLASYGITGLTDMTPQNDPIIAAHFRQEQARGALLQDVVVAGTHELGSAVVSQRLRLGPVKMHLHEAQLPDPETAVASVRAAHEAGRAVAVHCTTEVELVFALHAFETGGTIAGDRIEHASIAPDALVDAMTSLGLAVVAQPNFVWERGDQYLTDVEQECLPWLYRLQSLQNAGIILAGGSDAPFGEPDPWAAMAAATTRRTRGGNVVGPQEALSPEAALSLFLADPLDLGRQRRIEPGAPADLCLLNMPWENIRSKLPETTIRATIIGGEIVHDRVDQAPFQRRPAADPLA